MSVLFSKAKCLKEIRISFAGNFFSYFIQGRVSHTVPDLASQVAGVTGACHYTRPKQHDTSECLTCQIDYKLSDEATASKVLKKINSKLKLLYRQNTFLTHSFRRLLCNALIQPHFDLSTSLMVSSFKEKFKNQTTKAVFKNKCIRFYLNLPPKS